MDKESNEGEHRSGSAYKKISRRVLLGGAAGAAIVLLKSSYGRTIQTGGPSLLPIDPTSRQGTAPGEIGSRSAFERLVKKSSDTSSRTPLQDLYGTITPSDLHYERHHAGVPVIDPLKYELLVHGMVDRPTVFSLADLKKFPAVSRTCFIECSGNFRNNKEEMTAQE